MKTKSNVLFLSLLTFVFAGASALVGNDCADGFCTVSNVYAQVNRGPVAPKRDPLMEKESAHHLDVAWQYFKKKVDKNDPEANTRRAKAMADRLNEVLDTNPDFSKIDEVYYLLGEIYNRLADKDKAVHYLSKVVNESPDSKYYREAKKRLDELQGSAPTKEGKEKS
ncbi:MAG TPA: tetratricopeptide repeat protein [Blastocatellia bacterium]|nr:tetratricopeptide repeat protein [Blastocatellia bacterium]